LEELRSVLSKMGRLYSKDEIENIISTVDENKDGLISIDEFSHLLN
jgi:Ca2+-binding EF-hand superfamily protein